MTVITDSGPKLKLKIKISSSKTIEVEPRNEVCDHSQQLWMNDDQRGYSISQKSVTKMSHNIVHQTLDHPKVYDATDNIIIRSSVQCSVKRGPTSIIECQAQKRQKMDCSVKQQCGSIIDSLLSKDFSAGFREPVDPVALRIPDYFQVIKEPMDLGTVRAKLEDDMYSSVEEFLADVRLIFSNAMKYNPPTDYFHKAAKKLDALFSTKWKSLEAKWKRERINIEQSWIVSCSKRKTQETSSIDPRNSPVRVSSSLSETTFMSTDEKRELGKKLVAAMRGNMTQQLQMLVKELGLSFQKVEKSEINLDGFEDATLRQLKRVVNRSLDAKASKVERGKLVQNSRCTLGKVSHKGQVSGHRSTCGSVSAMPLSTSASKCRLCGNMRCGCSLQNDIPHRSFINLTVEKLSGQDRGACKPDPDAKSILTSTISTPYPQYDDCTPGIDIQLSPGKALRAAMLKSRFADTILKAKQITLRKHDCKVDPVKLQQEKERLERQQQEEAARIEAQIRAAEAATALKAEEELRLQREREREAARIALQKMEKTVEVEDNFKILEELEMFIWRVTPDHLFYRPSGSEVRPGAGIGYFQYPLERFGLYVKEDYTSDEDIEDEVILQEDKEEGEILL